MKKVIIPTLIIGALIGHILLRWVFADNYIIKIHPEFFEQVEAQHPAKTQLQLSDKNPNVKQTTIRPVASESYRYAPSHSKKWKDLVTMVNN